MATLQRINKEVYHQNMERYELRTGDTSGAPLCPYGNTYQWIGYDKEAGEYVRFTKSVFNKLMREAAMCRWGNSQ